MHGYYSNGKRIGYSILKFISIYYRTFFNLCRIMQHDITLVTWWWITKANYHHRWFLRSVSFIFLFRIAPLTNLPTTRPWKETTEFHSSCNAVITGISPSMEWNVAVLSPVRARKTGSDASTGWNSAARIMTEKVPSPQPWKARGNLHGRTLIPKLFFLLWTKQSLMWIRRVLE